MIRIFERHSAAARWSRRLAVFAVPLLILTTGLHRFGQLDTPVALILLGISIALAIVALALGVGGLVGIWRHGGRGAGSAFLGILMSLAIVAWPGWILTGLATKPQLSDVTTDWQQPPPMQAAAQERQLAGDEIPYDRSLVRLQAAAYPEIVPYFLGHPAHLVFEAAETLVARRGWRVLSATPPEDGRPGVIEAVARTLLFGFEDDVALRITPRGDAQTRVDMRSASRYGAHDLGTNADRVYRFLRDLQVVLESERELLLEEGDTEAPDDG